MGDDLLDKVLMPHEPETAEDMDHSDTKLRHQGVRGQRQQPVGEDLQDLLVPGDNIINV